MCHCSMRAVMPAVAVASRLDGHFNGAAWKAFACGLGVL